jgi:hypothetical protein
MRFASRSICLLAALGSLAFLATTRAYPAETDPAILSTIDSAIGAINSGSEADLQAVFVDSPMAITDDFAPFSWGGKTAVADYSRDLKAILAQYKISDWRFQRQSPRYIFLTDSRAEAVIPASFPFILSGKTQSVSADWLFILDKKDGKWKIDVMSFTDTHNTLVP